MNCTNAKQIHAYYDGEMSPAQRQAFETHLSACAQCKQELGELGTLSRLIVDAPAAVMPWDAVARLNGSFRAVRDRSVLRISEWLTAAAATLLLSALLFWPGQRGQSQSASVTGPSAWQTVAVLPVIDTSEEDHLDMIVLAQWMADDLSLSENQ